MRIPCRLTTAWGRPPFPWKRTSTSSVGHGHTFIIIPQKSITVSVTSRKSYSTDKGSSISWSQYQFSKAASGKGGVEDLPLPRNGGSKFTAYIALGSNLGDRIGMIEKACDEMSNRGLKIKRTSSLWETEPMYVLEQEKFINGACEVSFTILIELL